MSTILFGGSFDPVHQGHLAMAKCAAAYLPQARILWIPAACSPFKTGRTATAESHRLAMCRLAVAQESNMTVTDMEFTMEKPSYTVRTVAWLQQNQPDDYYFLCGGDSFLSLQKWKDFDRLIHMVTFLVANREGSPMEDLCRQKETIEALGGKAVLLSMKPVTVSSTQLRTLLQQGEDVSHLLPPAVERYIQEKGLYKE